MNVIAPTQRLDLFTVSYMEHLLVSIIHRRPDWLPEGFLFRGGDKEVLLRRLLFFTANDVPKMILSDPLLLLWAKDVE